MPKYTRETISDRLPWVDVEAYQIFYLDFRDEHKGVLEIEPSYERENLVCLGGEVAVESSRGRVTLKKKDWIEIPATGVRVTTMRTTPMTGSSEVLWMGGHWRESYYMSIFQFRPDKPLEMHYHDNDEYWFIFRGHVTAIYNGAACDLVPGDMLATGMGYEHGVPESAEVAEGVGFTPFLDGRKRFGHLHRAEHGDPVPNRAL